MKTPLLCLFAFVAWVCAHAADDAKLSALRAADDARVTAMKTADAAQLGVIFSNDLRYAHSNAAVDNKASLIDTLVSGRTKYAVFDYEDRDFTTPAPGIALMTGRAHIQAVTAKGTMDSVLSFLSVWREEKGQWRFLAWQSCKVPPADPAILQKEFIYETAPFASAHASTIVQAREGGLVTAWFGGTAEGKPDVGIWVSRLEGNAWVAPVEVANGVQADGVRHPCWNPVLFQPKEGDLTLFYKVGPSPATWWGMLRTSADNGKTWSEAKRLPEGILGPIKNKPVQLPDGTIISSASTETTGKPSVWRGHFERSSDNGNTWSIVEPSSPGSPPLDIIQPSILFLGGDKLMALGRSKQAKVFQVHSNDFGKTWGEVSTLALPNPNSGTDAVTMKDGRHVLIYNHTPKGRSPLNVAISKDGETWQAALVLEDTPKAEFSYPAVIQTKDGLLHFTYTWKRQKVRHVVVDPARLTPREMPNGQWPQ